MKLSFGVISLLFLVIRVSGLGRQYHLSRKLEVINDSGDTVGIDWLNPATGERVLFSYPTEPGETVSVDSFVNHTFVVWKGDNGTSTCLTSESSSCKEIVSFLTVGDKDEQKVVIREGLRLDILDDETRQLSSVNEASEITLPCREATRELLANGVDVSESIDHLVKCLEERTSIIFERKNEELAFQSELRRKISSLAENYTCADPSLETSRPKEVRTWNYNGVTRQVGILHDRPSSQIHVLSEFISPEECEAIKAAAASTLHRGTVADGKGGSRMSDHRKAWQAGISADWNKEVDLVAQVSKRLFAYANYVTGYNMSIEGQEDLMSIQYFGNGLDDPTPDRYTPHCDGDCDGRPHKTGGRVATMVMYCDAPELGGATNFQNANVFVKPQVGAAAFFSYMDPVTKLQEAGFTTHSGCPVYKGTKRIAVQWMRVGVDAKNPWDSFDTNTIKRSIIEEFDDDMPE